MIKQTGHYSCPQPGVILSGGTLVATTPPGLAAPAN